MRFGGIIHDTEEMATPFSIGEAIAYVTVQPLDSIAFSSCTAANRRTLASEPVGIIPNPNRRNNPFAWIRLPPDAPGCRAGIATVSRIPIRSIR